MASDRPPPHPSRRTLLATLAGAGALVALRRSARGEEPEPRPAGPRPPVAGRLPVLFVGHGSPLATLDRAKGGLWSRWTSGLGRPSSILVVSAHWERAPVTIGATTAVPLVYDFTGFPREMYALRYPAPGAPSLADRVERLLAPGGAVRRDPRRGLDHGAWCPLRWLYPRADVPALALSLPTQDPASLVRMGRALAPLRDEGTLILASGNVVHNLRALGRDGAETPAWAREFDLWCADALARRDVDALVDWRRRAPAAATAHPTAEHLTPLFVALGAGLEPRDAVRFPVTGFEAGSISRRCVQLD